MNKSWNNISAFLSQGFNIRELYDHEYKNEPALNVLGLETGIGYLNKIHTAALDSFFKRSIQEYSSELNKLLSINKTDREKLINEREKELINYKKSLPDLDSYKRNNAFMETGTQQVTEYDEVSNDIINSSIPTYKPKFNHTKVKAMESVYRFIHELHNLHNEFLIKFGTRTKADITSFNYTGQSNEPIKRVYNDLLRHSYLNKSQVSLTEFKQLFWGRKSHKKIDWKATKSSLKYFIDKLFKLKSIQGLKGNGKQKWQIASSIFTCKNVGYTPTQMKDFDSKVSKEHAETIDAIIKHLE